MPGLRRLRDPRRGAGVHAGARHPAREHRLRLRHRLRGALPVLHADVRHALDPRPRAGDRDGSRRVAPRSLGVGRDRRRRRAVDRRQSPDPRAAPQREREDPDVQQPDLRADEGAVLADERPGQGDGLDADGQRRLSVQPARAGARRRGDVRRARARHRQAGPDRRAAPCRRAPGRRVRRGLPELQHLQRRRVRLHPRGQGSADVSRARPGVRVDGHHARRERLRNRVRARAAELGEGRRDPARRLPRRAARLVRRARPGAARERQGRRRSAGARRLRATPGRSADRLSDLPSLVRRRAGASCRTSPRSASTRSG